jgi:hypothetical protein
MKRQASRATVIKVLGALVLLLLAQPAWSAPRPRPITGLCDFPVTIGAVGEQLERTTLPNGVVIITGRQVATVTNAQTGEAAAFNVSGPVQFDPDANRVTLLGPSLVLGEGLLIQTKGQVSFVLNEPIEAQVGTHTDVCAVLAA